MEKAIVKKRRGEIIFEYVGILLHVPHSSISFPEESNNYPFLYLDEEEKLLIDYYTDELFIPSEKEWGISSAVFPYCRLFCDVERLVNDPENTKD